MTDGIIQKLFNKFSCERSNPYYDMETILEPLKQELIQEIKKDWRNMTLTKMIGDNE